MPVPGLAGTGFAAKEQRRPQAAPSHFAAGVAAAPRLGLKLRGSGGGPAGCQVFPNELRDRETSLNVAGEEIKKALALDINEELMHARQLGERIKQLGGAVGGSLSLKFGQKALQPPEDTTDVTTVIEGVIQAEEGAILQYNKIIRLCEGTDYVTQDLCIRLLSSEEAHRVMFEGFLKEYRKKA